MRVFNSLRASIGLVIIFQALLFLITASQYPVGYADSSELIAASLELSVAHPPGYPLLTSLGHLFISTLRQFSPAHVAHLLNALLTIGANTMVFVFTIQLLSKGPRIKFIPVFASIFGLSVVAFSPLNWLYTSVFEIAALTKILLALTLIFTFKWYTNLKNARLARTYLNLTALSIGLLLSHYQLALACLPAFLVLLIHTRSHWYQNAIQTVKTFSIIGFFVGAGFVLPNLLLLHFNALPTDYSWYFEPTLGGLKNHVFRSDYSGYFIDQDINRDAYFANPGLNFFRFQTQYWAHLNKEITLIGISILLLGVWTVVRSRHPLGLFALTLAIFTGPVVAGYMGFPDPLNSMEYLLLYGIGERQLLMHYLTLIPLIAIGYFEVAKFTTKLVPKKVAITGFMLLGLSSTAFLITRSLPVGNQRNNQFLATYSKSVLESVKPNSVIICASDISCYSLMYATIVDNPRPDVTLLFKNNLYRRHFINRNAQFYGFSYLSNPDYYANLIAWNLISKPVYITEPDEYYIDYIGLDANPFYLVPSGYLFEVVKTPPDTVPEPNYATTDYLINAKISSLDYFGTGIKNYFASHHYLAGIISANYGESEVSRRHFGLALTLLPHYQHAADKLVELQGYEGNQLYQTPIVSSRKLLEIELAKTLEEGYLQTAYDTARRLTYYDPLNSQYREQLISILIRGQYFTQAAVELNHFMRLFPDLSIKQDLLDLIATSSAELNE